MDSYVTITDTQHLYYFRHSALFSFPGSASQALTYDKVSSLFQIVFTLSLPPLVEGRRFKTLSLGGRGDLETEILRPKLAHIRKSLENRKRVGMIIHFEFDYFTVPPAARHGFRTWIRLPSCASRPQRL
jgi:hypothetical protein